jgi:hypothetical protein
MELRHFVHKVHPVELLLDCTCFGPSLTDRPRRIRRFSRDDGAIPRGEKVEGLNLL